MVDAKHYDPKIVEKKWRDTWEKQKLYAFDPKKKNVYSIDTPPPTVSGNIHMGHAFSYTHTDIIARYKRMQGFNVFYPFGFDNNGLATERLVEKDRKVKATQMSREAFAKLCSEVSKTYEDEFKTFWGDLGLSVDWDLLYATIEPRVRKISQLSFIELYNKGRQYRKEAPTIWCPECQTAIAQVELEDKEKETNFVSIEAQTEDGKPIVFATTRPELYPSCVGMSVHPDDDRYKDMVGKTVTLPLTNAKVTLTADELVNPEFGTGVVYFCSSGDTQFLEWEARHPVKNKMYIVNKDGTLNEKAGNYKGLTITEARKKIVEDLQALGVVKKIEPRRNVVNVHERCGTDIEYISSKQWFIKYLDLKDKFLALGKELNWYPQHMRVRYDNWIKGLKWDWCVSRQRYSGVPFPVWYCNTCEEIIIADVSQLPVDPLKDKPLKPCSCGSTDFTPEQDILDTWATSSLTPYINMHWKEQDNDFFDNHFPMSLRPQAHDIITFWLFNTVVKSHLHDNKLPWKDVMISGHGLDPKGKKMSKSKGNVINPIDLLKNYPADAIRYWTADSKLGDDLAYHEQDVKTGQKTITKLWNASKFVFMHLEDYQHKEPKHLEQMDFWLLSKLQHLIKQATEAFDAYEYSKVKNSFDNFFWNTFCDYYLEIVKDRLYNPYKRGKEARQSAQYTLHTALQVLLKLFAPIMPFITEEIYAQHYNKEEKNSIHISAWPQPEPAHANETAEEVGDVFINILTKVRQEKSKHNKPLNAEIHLTLDKADYEKLTDVLEDLKAATKAQKITSDSFSVKLI